MAPSNDKAGACGPPGNVRLRPIRPDDWRRLQRFHDRLSFDTVHLRFHGAKRHLSEPLAHRFTGVDGHASAAIVATTGTRGRIVAVARYITVAPGTAEVAFVVEDAYQHHGLGRRLMRCLCSVALENGITDFVADVVPGNMPMLHLLRDAGEAHTVYDNGSCMVHVRLAG